MKGELKRKTVRTVHGKKVVRLRIDVEYDSVMDYGDENQDVLHWLDKSVDELVDFTLQTFEDDEQVQLDGIDDSNGEFKMGEIVREEEVDE